MAIRTEEVNLVDTNSITLHRQSDPGGIAAMKVAYLATLSAPMDGMWGAGFIDPSPHWEIREDEISIGFFATNGEDTLWQFYVSPGYHGDTRKLFRHVLEQSQVTKAVAATIDPTFLSLCLDVQGHVEVHTHLYELREVTPPTPERAADLRPAGAGELERVIQFQRACLGAGPEIEAWLQGYSGNLIKRGELFVLHNADEWIGLGERRRSDSQPGVADVGMMVHPDHRRQGWAGHILQLLCEVCRDEDLRPICSTTADNVAAQRAIERVGFRSRHRIMDVQLDPPGNV